MPHRRQPDNPTPNTPSHSPQPQSESGLKTPPGTTDPSPSSSSPGSHAGASIPPPGQAASQQPTAFSEDSTGQQPTTASTDISATATGDGDPAPAPYTSANPITLEAPGFSADDPGAIVLKTKTQVRFYFKERPEQKKSPVRDPQDPLFRPVVPESITFKFKIGPQKTLDEFKQLAKTAILPAVAGAATLAVQSPSPTDRREDAPASPSSSQTPGSSSATPSAATSQTPSPKWTVQPLTLVNLSTFFALYKTSTKRFYWLWGREQPTGRPTSTHTFVALFHLGQADRTSLQTMEN